MEIAKPTDSKSKPPSARMVKLLALAERAAKLNEGIIKERVAVRDPYGGYAIVVREIKA